MGLCGTWGCPESWGLVIPRGQRSYSYGHSHQSGRLAVTPGLLPFLTLLFPLHVKCCLRLATSFLLKLPYANAKKGSILRHLQVVIVSPCTNKYIVTEATLDRSNCCSQPLYLLDIMPHHNYPSEYLQMPSTRGCRAFGKH